MASKMKKAFLMLFALLLASGCASTVAEKYNFEYRNKKILVFNKDKTKQLTKYTAQITGIINNKKVRVTTNDLTNLVKKEILKGAKFNNLQKTSKIKDLIIIITPEKFIDFEPKKPADKVDKPKEEIKTENKNMSAAKNKAKPVKDSADANISKPEKEAEQKENPKKIKEVIVSTDETSKLEDSEEAGENPIKESTAKEIINKPENPAKKQRKKEWDSLISGFILVIIISVITVLLFLILLVIISSSSTKDASQKPDAPADEDNSSGKGDAVELQEKGVQQKLVEEPAEEETPAEEDSQNPDYHPQTKD